jgi:hypothetical protein
MEIWRRSAARRSRPGCYVSYRPSLEARNLIIAVSPNPQYRTHRAGLPRLMPHDHRRGAVAGHRRRAQWVHEMGTAELERPVPAKEAQTCPSIAVSAAGRGAAEGREGIRAERGRQVRRDRGISPTRAAAGGDEADILAVRAYAGSPGSGPRPVWRSEPQHRQPRGWPARGHPDDRGGQDRPEADGKGAGHTRRRAHGGDRL